LNNFPLEILYEDTDIIAINKPAGLLTHPSWLTSKGTPNLASIVKDYFQGGIVHTVHRVDRATSGVILIAKNKSSAQRLSQDFEEKKVTKTYLCVVRGYAPDQGVIDHSLVYKHDKKAEPFAKLDQQAQTAITHFKRLAQVQLPISVGKWPAARYSLVEAQPQTGRKHQLRRHFKHILCPIVGDTNYGEGRHNRLFKEHFNIQRLLLMAVSVEFNHPKTGERMKVGAPLSAEVTELFNQFNWQAYT
jgi:tRNA pseudouridine65 synthase